MLGWRSKREFLQAGRLGRLINDAMTIHTRKSDIAAGCAPIPEDASRLLFLGPGCAWRVNGSCDAGHLLTRITEVMALPPVGEGGYPRMLFTRCDPGCAVCSAWVTGAAAGDGSHERWRPMDLPYLRMWTFPGTPGLLCQLRHWDNAISDTARIKAALNPVYMNVIAHDGFPIHGGLIQYEGKGVILAGHGDVGKTTACTRILHPFQARSDDETTIVCDQGRVFAHPMPTWSSCENGRPLGSTFLHPRIPLVAVCFLKQSPEIRLSPMGQGQAAVRMHQSAWETLSTYTFFQHGSNRDHFRQQVFDNACRVARQIPAFTLHLSLTGDFWTPLRRMIRSDGEGVI